MFGGLGMWEVLLIFLVVLLLFGAKRLPEIGSSLGKGIREFKGSLREIESEFKVDEEGPRRDQQESTSRSPSEKEQEGPRRLTSSDDRVDETPRQPSETEKTATGPAEGS